MMNIDPVPPIPAMNTAAVQFLDLLADPAAARKLMNDLVAAHGKAVAAHEEALRLRSEVIQKQATLDREKQDFETNKAAHSAFLHKTGAELDAREVRAKEVDHLLISGSSALDEREAKIVARETSLQERESRTTAGERDLAAAKNAHQRHAERLSRAIEHFHQAVAVLSE